MKLLKKKVKHEDGQVLVLVALLMVVLVGFAALLIDVGMMYLTKANMQNAADAAALAGVQKLPDDNSAISTAMDFAKKNGLKATVNKVKQDGDTVTVTPDNIDPYKIAVVCTRTVPFSFAKVLGFTDGDVSARAVAKLVWAGEALPFINMYYNYYAVPPKIELWEKTSPGDFGSMQSIEYEWDPESISFTIDYTNGIAIKKGYVATIKQEVLAICEQSKPVYLFSLSKAAMESDKYDLKNGTVIQRQDLVLLQVTFDNCVQDKTYNLSVTGVFDINNGEYPTDNITDGISSLVE